MLSHLSKLRHVGLIDEDRTQHTSRDRHRDQFLQGCEKRSSGKQVQRKRSSFLRVASNNGEKGKEGETSIILEGVVDR